MTTKQAFDAQADAVQNAMPLNGFQHVFRTGGFKSAS
jgi:hypothetical protein